MDGKLAAATIEPNDLRLKGGKPLQSIGKSYGPRHPSSDERCMSACKVNGKLELRDIDQSWFLDWEYAIHF